MGQTCGKRDAGDFIQQKRKTPALSLNFGGSLVKPGAIIA